MGKFHFAIYLITLFIESAGLKLFDHKNGINTDMFKSCGKESNSAVHKNIHMR